MKVKSILISQPKPELQNSPYNIIAKKWKVKIDFRPFIHVEGKTSREVRQQKIDLSKYSAIILTSRNSVDHFFRIAEEMRFPIPNALKYFCLSWDYRTFKKIQSTRDQNITFVFMIT